jgi:hypothetical protein
MGVTMKILGWIALALAVSALALVPFVEPAHAVYPWEWKCDRASEACQRSKYRRQCMCRHGCKAYCSNESKKAGPPLVLLAQHSRDNSRRRETVIPKRRYINPYHTPGVSRLVRDGRGW